MTPAMRWLSATEQSEKSGNWTGIFAFTKTLVGAFYFWGYFYFWKSGEALSGAIR